jgi:16S rRNA (cytidine1402-2'-O)-methyltransferase
MSETKRQDLPPGLWVVATPIGNLGDLSPRARAALEEADALLCEDTRTTQTLLSACGIRREPGSLLRLDAHAEKKGLEEILGRLQSGESLALVSDAGTPGVSDPGARLVAQAREAGIKIIPVPGPSAVAALISVLGAAETPFTFRGFFPRKPGERERELELVAANTRVSRAYAWFESPHRIVEALQAVAGTLPSAQVLAAKEMTKFHEKYSFGEAEAVAGAVAAEISAEGPRGEWCFAIVLPETQAGSGSHGPETGESSDWVKALRCLLDAGVSASEAAKQVSHHFGIAKNTAYSRSLELSGKKADEGA